jgi:hypothetical protein
MNDEGTGKTDDIVEVNKMKARIRVLFKESRERLFTPSGGVNSNGKNLLKAVQDAISSDLENSGSSS